jgi:phage major head subunit gpT-like protein
MITRYEVQTWLRMALRQTPKSDMLAALAKRVTSALTENQSERVAMLGTVGPLRAFTGESQPDKPIETTYSIRNEKFNRGVALPGSWLRNDKTDQTRDRVAQLGARYVQWPGALIAQLINAGNSTPCLDGQNFFSTTHAIGRSGTWSNDLTYDIATPAAPTADEISKAINFAIAQMVGFPDDQGEPFNEGMEAVTIVCHHSKSDVFTAALEAVNLDTGTGVRTNALQFSRLRKQLIASPRLTGLNSANAFAIIRSDAQAAPFLFQENLAEHRLEIMDESSDHYKKMDEMVANVWAVGNAGYGLPQDAARVVLV